MGRVDSPGKWPASGCPTCVYRDPEVDKVVLQHPKWQVEGRLVSRKISVSNIYHYFTSQCTPLWLKTIYCLYDFKRWPDTWAILPWHVSGSLMNSAGAGTFKMAAAVAGHHSFSRLVGLLSQWLSAPREQKLSGPLRARGRKLTEQEVKAKLQGQPRFQEEAQHRLLQEEQHPCPRLGGIVGGCLLSHFLKKFWTLLPGARVYSHFI